MNAQNEAIVSSTDKVNPFNCKVCLAPMYWSSDQLYKSKKGPGLVYRLTCTCGHREDFEQSVEVAAYAAIHPKPHKWGKG